MVILMALVFLVLLISSFRYQKWHFWSLPKQTLTSAVTIASFELLDLVNEFQKLNIASDKAECIVDICFNMMLYIGLC